MNKIKHIELISGTQEWTTENNKNGVSLFPPEPNKYRSRCNEICVWKSGGYHGVAVSCTLKDWLEKTRQGIRVRELVCNDLGINVPMEIDKFLRNGE